MTKKMCDLCGSTKIKILINFKGPSLTSDRRITNNRLKKYQCEHCGLIFGDKLFNRKEKNHYEKKYSYNSSNNGDSVFFTTSGNKDRSSQVFQWIMDTIPHNNIKNAKTIIEVGCGDGNLLLKFSKKFPKKTIIGFELNKNAIKQGKEKGLDIRNLKELQNTKADIIISYAVIEHTESPKLFLKSLSNSLTPDGIIVIGQPHQNKIYYDLFFIDHLYHFSIKHLEDYGRVLHLKLVTKSIGRWPIDTFSLHIFKNSLKLKNYIPVFRKTHVAESLNFYSNIFEKINSFLMDVGLKKPIAVFGLGELFSIFWCYTKLKNANIEVGFDDFPKKDHDFKFHVFPSNNVSNSNFPVLVCVNPKYYSIIANFFTIENNIFFPFLNNVF